MTDSATVDIDDLEAFEADFYGKAEEPVDETAETPAEEEEVEENEEDSPLATDEETDESDPEGEEDESEEEDEPEPEPKPKKSKTQQRIEQLLERERLANERAEALEKRLAALEAGKEEEKPQEKNVRDQLPAEAPSPDAVDDKGEPLYPLGEFDPQFIRDLTKFTIEQERKAAKEADEREAAAKAVKAEQDALTEAWNDKVVKAEEELPDLREKIQELGQTFGNIEPNYGEYLAMTIMGSEVGPEIMYYLSQNIGEAQKIVASGPAAATLALGRLEARLMKAPEEKRNVPPKKVSGAPTPPEGVNRGNRGQFTVRPDTDNLEAFEREFYKK